MFIYKAQSLVHIDYSKCTLHTHTHTHTQSTLTTQNYTQLRQQKTQLECWGQFTFGQCKKPKTSHWVAYNHVLLKGTLNKQTNCKRELGIGLYDYSLSICTPPPPPLIFTSADFTAAILILYVKFHHDYAFNPQHPVSCQNLHSDQAFITQYPVSC